jgi:hypothetical protein
VGQKYPSKVEISLNIIGEESGETFVNYGTSTMQQMTLHQPHVGQVFCQKAHQWNNVAQRGGD